jgi:hypothetical protein
VAIKAGDLVAVVKPARCCSSFLGAHFTVTGFRIARAGTRWACLACGRFGTIEDDYQVADGHGDCGVAVERLKRIPPLDELEGEKTKEELHA